MRLVAKPSADHPRARGEHGRPPQVNRPRPDHPRARGEHCSCSVRRRFSIGSSPRSREHAPRASAEQVKSGSSPRSRGTRLVRRCDRREHRIIPALAGNTPGSPFSSGSMADHPRARGEHSSQAANAMLSAGSSRRSRGTLLRQGGAEERPRIIPRSRGTLLREVLDAPEFSRCQKAHRCSADVHGP